jgi:uncharacterized membrane protein YfcA
MLSKSREVRTPFAVFGSGAAIGALGGLIGLGGAEFRLPLLIGLFGFGALEAVILNKAMSLIVVAAALPLRTGSVPFSSVLSRWDVVLTLLSGSLAGAWFGASWATRLQSRILYRVIAVLLAGIAAALLWGHGVEAGRSASLEGLALAFAGAELLIPTIVLLFGLDLKLAGSLSLAVSLPTMVTSFARYSRDRSFAVIGAQRRFIAVMALGSLAGAWLGGVLLGLVPTGWLLPALAAILALSAVKVWRHG